MHHSLPHAKELASLRGPSGASLKAVIESPAFASFKVMLQADMERLHQFMLEMEGVRVISDEMRTVIESEWPELMHKLPPREQSK
jgi:hypothetical protein